MGLAEVGEALIGLHSSDWFRVPVTVRLYASTTCSRASCSDGFLALGKDADLCWFCGSRISTGIAGVGDRLFWRRLKAVSCGRWLLTECASVGKARSGKHSSAQVTLFGLGEDAVSVWLEESPGSWTISGFLVELPVSGV